MDDLKDPSGPSAEEPTIAHVALWLDDETRAMVESRLAGRGLTARFVRRRAELQSIFFVPVQTK
jgi:hypothetical protein